MGKIAAILFAALSIIAPQAGMAATTWYVDGAVSPPGDGTSWETAFKTIQEGIGAASDGNTVIVAWGTYVENIHFHGKNITLTSTDPLDRSVVSQTIVDGSEAGSVVTFAGDENETCVLSGFTIRNGRATNGAGICGGDEVNHTQATIQNNIMTENLADRSGGSLAFCDGAIEDNTISANTAERGCGGLYDCDGTIQGNVISENEAIGISPAGYGGGLAHCDGLIADNTISGNKSHGAEQWLSEGGGGLTHCNGTIENNVITDNWAIRAGGGLCQCHGIIRGNTISGNSGDRGGGLGYCNAVVQDNTITGNSAADYNSSGGGLAWCSGPILNNTISGNVADGFGGGLHYCDGPIERNVIAGNVVKYDGGGLYGCNNTIQNNVISCNSAHFHGGGLAYCEGTLLNNTICGNSAFIRGGGLHVCQGSIRNCIVWGNAQMRDPQLYDSAAPSYCCIQNWSGGGQGNVSDDPQFVDPDGTDDTPETYEDNDYRLAEGSPCIDAGRNQDWMWEATDLDGGPRILYGGASFAVDMGAYEHRPMHLVQCHTDRARMNFASGTVLLPVSITNFESELPEPFSIWLVVRGIVFPSPGPNSAGTLWNADGITSDLYLGAGAYYYVDISDLPPPDGEDLSQAVLEFYVRDRNPNFEPVIELWAFRPIPNSARHTPEEGIAPHLDNSGNGTESFGGNPPAVWLPDLQINRLASLPGEAILLQWKCRPGNAFVVQAAESPMGPWTEISDHIQSLGTLAQWVDSPPSHVKRRFYRILQMPR